MPYVESGGAQIYWEAEGQGTPVLLIMGTLYELSMWYPLMPALSARHRVIRFDNRGAGNSDTTNHVTIEQMAADALAVLHASGETAAHIYGVSLGGGVAAEFGMAYPECTLSLTLGCTMLKTTRGGSRSGRPSWLYYLPRWAIRWLMKRTASVEAYGSLAPRDKVEEDMRVIAKQRFSVRGVRNQSMAVAKYATTRERAADRLRMPVLVLHGDEDQAVPVEAGRELAAAIPGSEYVEFRGAGHNYLVAANGASTDAFIEFIDRVDSRSSGRGGAPIIKVK